MSENAEIQRLRETLMSTTATLAATISLIEQNARTLRASAPSNLIFGMMLSDYRKSLEKARAVLRETPDGQ